MGQRSQIYVRAAGQPTVTNYWYKSVQEED